MKYVSLQFYWYECRQADPFNQTYFVINLINGNVVEVASMSSALKTAWLAYTLRKGQYKPIDSLNLELKAYKLEGWPIKHKRWGVHKPEHYDYDKYGWELNEISKFQRNAHPIGYYINMMQFKNGIRRGLLRKGDLREFINYKGSKRVH